MTLYTEISVDRKQYILPWCVYPCN